MTNILEEKFTGPMVWRAETVLPNGGLSTLNGVCHAEIAATAQVLRDNPLPVEALRAEDFEIPACEALMAEVRETVDNGVGFTVIDRLDVDVLGREICTRIYWLLMSMIGRPVAQKWAGALVYDVRDTGVKVVPGNSVRSSETNGAARFHNDNHRLAHRRTAFHDWDEPGKKRHLVRLWLRKSGRPFYQG